MSADKDVLYYVLAGFVSGLLLGVIVFRSDAESKCAAYRHKFMRALNASVLTLRGFMGLVVTLALIGLAIWLPGHLLGVFPLHEAARIYQLSLICGALLGGGSDTFCGASISVAYETVHPKCPVNLHPPISYIG